MTEQESTHGIERIVFEAAPDGRWRMRTEGEDVEGQSFRFRRSFEVEAAGEDESGEPLYSLKLDGEDVEGQGFRIR